MRYGEMGTHLVALEGGDGEVLKVELREDFTEWRQTSYDKQRRALRYCLADYQQAVDNMTSLHIMRGLTVEEQMKKVKAQQMVEIIQEALEPAAPPLERMKE